VTNASFRVEGAGSATAFFRGLPGLRLAGMAPPGGIISFEETTAGNAVVSIC
jgi:hypothetical protein